MWKSRELWIGVSINQSLTGTLSHLIVYILLWLLLHWMSELSSYKTTRPAKPTKAIVWSFTEKIGQPQFWRNSVIQDSVIKKGIQQMIPFLMLIWKKRNISKYTKIALPDHECGWFFLFIILWLFFYNVHILLICLKCLKKHITDHALNLQLWDGYMRDKSQKEKEEEW